LRLDRDGFAVSKQLADLTGDALRVITLRNHNNFLEVVVLP